MTKNVFLTIKVEIKRNLVVTNQTTWKHMPEGQITDQCSHFREYQFNVVAIRREGGGYETKLLGNHIPEGPITDLYD